MNRLLIAALLLIDAITPASATTLLTLPITTAISTTTPIQTKDWAPADLTIHCNFVYGSGGETVDAYAQMSVDSGSTWVDVAEPRRFRDHLD